MLVNTKKEISKKNKNNSKNEFVGVCVICRSKIVRGVKFTRRVVDNRDFYIHDVCFICPCKSKKDVILMRHSRVLSKFRENSRVYLYIYHQCCHNVYGCFACDVCGMDMGWNRIRLNTSGIMAHDACIRRIRCNCCKHRFRNAGVDMIRHRSGIYNHVSCVLRGVGGNEGGTRHCLICFEYIDWKKFNMLPISIYQRYKIHVSCFTKLTLEGGGCSRGGENVCGVGLHWLTLAWYMDGDCLLSILPRDIFIIIIRFVFERRLSLRRRR